MKALSIRQPWAWAILHAGKRIENRDWRGCSYRGPLLIHASLWGGTGPQREKVFDDTKFVMQTGRSTGALPADPVKFGAIMQCRGGIVGVCDLVDVVCVDRAGYRPGHGQIIVDPWAFGPCGLVLDNVRPLPFVPFKGTLGFFDVPDDLVAGVRP